MLGGIGEWAEKREREQKTNTALKQTKWNGQKIMITTCTHSLTCEHERVHSFIHSRLRMLSLSLSLTCFFSKVFGYVCSFQSIFTCWLNWFCAFILFMLFSLFASRIFARFVTAFIVSTSHTHTRWYGIDVVVCPVFNREKFWVFWS